MHVRVRPAPGLTVRGRRTSGSFTMMDVSSGNVHMPRSCRLYLVESVVLNPCALCCLKPFAMTNLLQAGSFEEEGSLAQKVEAISLGEDDDVQRSARAAMSRDSSMHRRYDVSCKVTSCCDDACDRQAGKRYGPPPSPQPSLSAPWF